MKLVEHRYRRNSFPSVLANQAEWEVRMGKVETGSGQVMTAQGMNS